MPQPVVTGRFVRLCELSDEDTDFIVRWRNHADIREWLPSSEPLSASGHRAWLARCRDRGDLVLSYRDGHDQICGQISLYDIDRASRHAEFGRVFAAPDLANPFAVLEAYYLTHRLGFERLGLAAIRSATVTANVRAVRLLRGLGYERERHLPGALITPWGDRRDVDVFQLTPATFRRATLEHWLYRKALPPHIDTTGLVPGREAFR